MRPNVVCSFLNVSQKTLMEYNPALRPVVFFQQKQIPADFTIRIPSASAVPDAQKALAAVPDSLKSDAPERLAYYSVEKGDNLFGIASRMGVTVEQLVLENNITRSRRIYAGQVLRIPGVSAKTQVALARPESSLVAAEKPPVQHAPAKIAQRKAAAQETGAVAVAAPLRARVSDSLKDVALLAADTLPVFSKNGGPSLMPAFDASVYDLEEAPSADGASARIRVSVDETIGHYADWCGVPTYRIRQLNGMGSRSEIRMSRSLVIPADEDALARFVKARLEYHMALEEDFYSRYKVADVRLRAVRKGETLWSICNGEDQIPLWLFKKYNKQLDLTLLQPGMQVWIPVIEEKTEQDIALESGQAIGIYPVYEEPARKGSSLQIKRVP